MGSQQKLFIGSCPLCDETYTLENNITHHHIFPKYWYGKFGKVRHLGQNIVVEVCHQCHEVEFNGIYPMNLRYPWSPTKCLIYWIEFCYYKGKNPFDTYPQLERYENMKL